MNTNFTIFIIILSIILFIMLIIFSVKIKTLSNKEGTSTDGCPPSKKCEKCETCETCSTCKTEIDDSISKLKQGLPKSFIYESKNNVIDLTKINSSINYPEVNEDNMYTLTNEPVYFPNGIKIYLDEPVHAPSEDEITDTIKDDEDDTYDDDESTTPKNFSVMMTSIKDITIKPVQDKIRAFFSEYIYSVNYYIGLISDFLLKNPEKTKTDNWQTVINILGYIKQINDLYLDTDASNMPEIITYIAEIKNQFEGLVIPSINDIYNSAKFTLTQLGGLSFILRKYENRIKWDMIQSIINDDPKYRTVSNENITNAVGSGKCTAFPLEWNQHCQKGKKPVGSKGWDKNSKKSACNKWYQHASGELLCADYSTEITRPVKGICQAISKIDNLKLIVGQDGLNESKKIVIKILGKILAKILSALALTPQTASTIHLVSIIIRLAITKAKEDFSWILYDLKDVCYNYMCSSDNYETDQVCAGNTDYICVPAENDNKVANRKCNSANTPGCNMQASGSCESKTKLKALNSVDSANVLNNFIKYSDYS